MTTAATTITRARFKIHDENSTYFDTDSYLLTLINTIIEEIHSTLIHVESNLAYSHTTVTTATGTEQYTFSSAHTGILRDGVWRIGYGESPLAQVDETQRRNYSTDTTSGSIPIAFYLTESNNTMGFLYVPDDVYTMNVYYWKAVTQLTATTDSLPYDGIFDRYIEQRLVVDLLEIQERDNSRAAVFAQNEWNKAMTRIYALGLRPKKVVSNMFSIEGI